MWGGFTASQHEPKGGHYSTQASRGKMFRLEHVGNYIFSNIFHIKHGISVSRSKMIKMSKVILDVGSEAPQGVANGMQLCRVDQGKDLNKNGV